MAAGTELRGLAETTVAGRCVAGRGGCGDGGGSGGHIAWEVFSGELKANRRVHPLQLVTSGLYEGPQSPTIARWMRTDLNPVDPHVFSCTQPRAGCGIFRVGVANSPIGDREKDKPTGRLPL